MRSHLTDDEVTDICRPLTQSAAQVRYLKRIGLAVERRPDGSPLVKRVDWDRQRAQNDSPDPSGPVWGVH